MPSRGDKPIRWTPHAIETLRDRDIPAAEIERAIAEPEVVSYECPTQPPPPPARRGEPPCSPGRAAAPPAGGIVLLSALSKAPGRSVYMRRYHDEKLDQVMLLLAVIEETATERFIITVITTSRPQRYLRGQP